MTRWRILALLFLARIGLGLQFQTLASVGDTLSVAYGLDHANIGLLIGLFMAPGLFLAIPAGYWTKYVADRGMVVLGLGALADWFRQRPLTVGPLASGAFWRALVSFFPHSI